jgi:hypothetical protein
MNSTGNRKLKENLQIHKNNDDVFFCMLPCVSDTVLNEPQLSDVTKFPNFGKRKVINPSMSCVETQALKSLHCWTFRVKNWDELSAY